MHFCWKDYIVTGPMNPEYMQGHIRLLDAANMCGYLVASFMLPYIARRWSSHTEINSVVLRCRHFL